MAILMRVFISLATAATLLKFAAGATHTVGGPDGSWDLITDLQAWTASQKFTVGDTLTFEYLSPYHDVVEVSEADYGSCSASSPIKTYTGGLTTITLDARGKRYFICGTSGHCLAGMKIEIDTLPGGSTPATPPALVPPATPPALVPPATPPALVPSTPPPSKAPSPSTTPSLSPESTPQASITPSSSPESSPASTSPAPTSSPTTTPPSSSPPPPPPPPSSANKYSIHTSVALGLGFVVLIFLGLCN